MATIEARLGRGETVVLDGAMGTELQRRGVPMHGVAWSGAAVLTHPETVRAVHEDYIRAGADVIITNTFSTARHMLAPAGMGDDVAAANTRAVALALEARERTAGDRPVAVAGSISSMVARNDRSAAPPAAELQANYREQVGLLAGAGVDLIVLEMMRDVEQTGHALAAATATGLPVWIGYSCRRKTGGSGEVRLLGGAADETFAQAVEALKPLGGSVALVMHTDVEDTGPALAVLRQHWSGPIGAYAHSGAFRMPDWQFVDVVAPDAYARIAREWVSDAGAQIVGGCCGLGPDHIRVLNEQLPRRVPAA